MTKSVTPTGKRMEWVYKQLLELGPKQSKADQVGDLTENAVWRILKKYLQRRPVCKSNVEKRGNGVRPKRAKWFEVIHGYMVIWKETKMGLGAVN